jgi:hypothetical protein
MTKAKTGFKIIAAIFVSLGLVILSGLWRLRDAPLRLPVHFDIVRTTVHHFGIDFQEIYLFTPSMISLPGVLIEKGHFENERIQLKADQIFVRWKIGRILSGQKLWQTDTVHLESPILTFKPHDAKDNGLENTSIPVNSLTLKNGRVMNLPSGTLLPPHTLNGTFYQQQNQKTLHFYGRTLETAQEMDVEGSFSLEDARATGSITVSNLLLKEWAGLAPEKARPWLSFFAHPFPKITLNVKGNVLEKAGDIAAEIHAPFVANGSLHAVPVVATLTGHDTGDFYKVDLQVKTEPFPWPALSNLWPPFLSPTSHFWCTRRLQGGTALPITLRSQLLYDTKNPNLLLQSLEGTLGVDGTTVTYMDKMPPVERARAEATFKADEFTIRLLEGETQGLKVQPTSVVRFYDLQTTNPQGLVDLYIDGPLPDALWVADHPPLSFATQYGFDPKAIKGQSKNHLVLKFPTSISPTLKTMETTFDASVHDFTFTLPLLNDRLRFEKGDLDLSITSKKLSVSGSAHINGAPSTIEWVENNLKKAPFHKRYKVKTSLPFDEILRFTPLSVQGMIQNRPEFSLKGRPKLALVYTESKDQQGQLSLAFDLKNTDMALPLFGYTKEPKAPGTLMLSFSFQNGALTYINEIKAKAPNLSLNGSATFSKEGALASLDLKEMALNKTDIKGTLHQKKGVWTLDLKGPSLDLGSLVAFYKTLPETSDSPSNKTTPFVFRGDFGKIVLLKEIELPPLHARMEWKKDGLHAYQFLMKDPNNKEDVFSFQYIPGNSLESILFKTSILGEILKGLDVTESLSSENLSFTLDRPKGETQKPFKGILHMENLRMKDAPFLAKLFSLLSVESILSTLKGEGVLFIRGTSDFEYLNKKIAIQHLELTSSSLGLTGKGYIDLKDKTIDAKGYIIPANILNQLIGNIPFLGQLLSGNSKEHKGLVSMSYSMKGDLKDPTVSSNPLSALAPNFVKGLFSNLTGSASQTPSLGKG